MSNPTQEQKVSREFASDAIRVHLNAITKLFKNEPKTTLILRTLDDDPEGDIVITTDDLSDAIAALSRRILEDEHTT